MSFTVVIVTGDAALARVAVEALENARMRAQACRDGAAALELLERDAPDLLLIDSALPGGALALCRAVRSIPAATALPLMVLTEPGDHAGAAAALDAGADDCIGKPPHRDELRARVQALRRRCAAAAQQHKGRIHAGNIEMDLDRWTATVAGRPVELTRKEFHLLQELLEARGRVLTRDALLARVWPYSSIHGLDTRTVDVHVGRLRRKLGEYGRHIITVRNVGFRFDVMPQWLRKPSSARAR